MTTSTPGQRDSDCTYSSPRLSQWSCRFPEQRDHRCIFHLSVDKKDPDEFWRHLAYYMQALIEKAGNEDTADFVQQRKAKAWIFREHDEALLKRYQAVVSDKPPWHFVGFVFPTMDETHNFGGFVFPEADFTHAEFNGAPWFADATFADGVCFRRTEFHGKTHFSGATFAGKADFRDATFDGEAHFTGATFDGEADFSCAEPRKGPTVFSAKADFSQTTFKKEAKFTSAEFCGEACFDLRTTFEERVSFNSAKFRRDASFRDVRFTAEADFSFAEFGAQLSFEWAAFDGAMTDFRDTKFSGRVIMRRTTVKGLFAVRYARLRNQLFFDGAVLDGNCRVLLWGLNFDHGTSDISMEARRLVGSVVNPNVSLSQDIWRGSLVEPAGQVVFRDIKTNMNRVSLLHTDILTDRLLVRFSNVKWEIDPREFIFDAKFAFVKHSEWNRDKLIEETGLPGWSIDRLPELFFADRPPPGGGTSAPETEWKAQQLRDCEPLVRQDVERIAREIRLSYEKYGHYGDAGDYYIAEMDYRRVRAPWWRIPAKASVRPQRWLFRLWRWSRAPLKPLLFATAVRRTRVWLLKLRVLPARVRSLLHRLALQIYRCTSMYGEQPNRAFYVLLSITVASGIIFLFTGFKLQSSEPTQRVFVPDLSQFGATLGDFFHAVVYSLTNLVPGWFRGHDIGPAGRPTSIVAIVETVLGTSVLTLFLLAIRRRFRR